MLSTLPQSEIESTFDSTRQIITVKITESQSLDQYVGEIAVNDLRKDHPLLGLDHTIITRLIGARPAPSGATMRLGKITEGGAAHWIVSFSATCTYAGSKLSDDMTLICHGPIPQSKHELMVAMLNRLRVMAELTADRVDAIERSRGAPKSAPLLFKAAIHELVSRPNEVEVGITDVGFSVRPPAGRTAGHVYSLIWPHSNLRFIRECVSIAVVAFNPIYTAEGLIYQELAEMPSLRTIIFVIAGAQCQRASKKYRVPAPIGSASSFRARDICIIWGEQVGVFHRTKLLPSVARFAHPFIIDAAVALEADPDMVHHLSEAYGKFASKVRVVSRDTKK